MLESSLVEDKRKRYLHIVSQKRGQSHLFLWRKKIFLVKKAPWFCVIYFNARERERERQRCESRGKGMFLGHGSFVSLIFKSETIWEERKIRPSLYQQFLSSFTWRDWTLCTSLVWRLKCCAYHLHRPQLKIEASFCESSL